MIPRETLERWSKLLDIPGWRWVRDELAEAVPALLTEVESQAKEIERLRAGERAARIEAVEEFRRRAIAALWDTTGLAAHAVPIDRRIAALPALPEEP